MHLIRTELLDNPHRIAVHLKPDLNYAEQLSALEREKLDERRSKLTEADCRQLMEEVDRTLDHMQDEAANFPDPNDRATQESEFALELRTRDRERKLISKINQSIAAIDAREYGFCESCGDEIGIRRLEARPTATLCYECKSIQEIREKQLG